MEINAGMVKELRDRTGAGMMDCKSALSEAQGDLEKAAELILKKGLAKAAKQAGRIAADGRIHAYVHNGRVGVLVEINSETDFVARNEEFKAFVEDVAMQIAAMSPEVVRREDIAASVVEKQKEIFEAQVKADGKPEKTAGKIVEGKLAKWFTEVCLLEQASIKNGDKTIEALRADLVHRTGENIQVRRFVRYELGEGIARKES